MPAPLAPDLRQQAKGLAIAGLTSYAISVKLGVNRSTVRNWLKDATIPALMASVEQAVKVVVDRQVDQKLSQVVRVKLSESIAAQAEQLANNPAMCVEELKNTPERQGLAAVTKTVVEAASTLFGWDKEGSTGVSLVGSLRRMDSIDVDEIVVDRSVNKVVNTP